MLHAHLVSVRQGPRPEGEPYWPPRKPKGWLVRLLQAILGSR